MKKKGRHELCKHVIGAFDEIVLVDLDCPQYSLICGTAVVTKQVCKYCPCLEEKERDATKRKGIITRGL